MLAIGSCFAEVMGRRMLDYKFKVQVNPCGIIFNPLSVAKLLQLSLAGKELSPEELVETPEGWRHFDLHSSHWAHRPEDLLTQGNQLLRTTQQTLLHADWLLLTLGTAYVYHRKETNTWVANCHKVPAAQFTKELLTVETLETQLGQLFSALFSVNSSLRVVITVSPVRHTKDTLVLNSVSKSILRVVSHQLTERFDRVAYFPAYEIMVDDLRDYRFYQPDMIHPSIVAEDYIWEQFAREYFSEATRQQVKEWTKIRQALAHRPLHPGTQTHEAFLQQLLHRLKKMMATIDVTEEIAQVEQQLADLG